MVGLAVDIHTRICGGQHFGVACLNILQEIDFGVFTEYQSAIYFRVTMDIKSRSCFHFNNTIWIYCHIETFTCTRNNRMFLAWVNNIDNNVGCFAWCISIAAPVCSVGIDLWLRTFFPNYCRISKSESQLAKCLYLVFISINVTLCWVANCYRGNVRFSAVSYTLPNTIVIHNRQDLKIGQATEIPIAPIERHFWFFSTSRKCPILFWTDWIDIFTQLPVIIRRITFINSAVGTTSGRCSNCQRSITVVATNWEQEFSLTIFNFFDCTINVTGWFCINHRGFSGQMNRVCRVASKNTPLKFQRIRNGLPISGH